MIKKKTISYAMAFMFLVLVILIVFAYQEYIGIEYQTEENPEKAEAEWTISLVSNVIEEAKENGKDTSAAEEKLAEAQESFEKEEYESAKEQAEDAVAFITEEEEAEEEYPPALPDEFFG